MKPILRAGVRWLPAPVLILASMLLPACSGSDAVTPLTLAPCADCYVMATITVLDAEPPCVPGNCPPEFFECSNLAPIATGQVFDFVGTVAAAGTVDPTTSSIGIVVSSSNPATRIGLKVELAIANPPATPPSAVLKQLSGEEDRSASFVNLNLACNQFNNQGLPASLFGVLDENDGCRCYPAGLSNTVTVDSLEVGPTGELVVAQQTGSGTFQPTGIMEGTFRFVAQNRQEVAAGVVTAIVLVEGCFRVNVPAAEQGVPVTATPTSGGC